MGAGPDVPGPVSSNPAELTPDPETESAPVVEPEAEPEPEEPTVERLPLDPPDVAPAGALGSYSGLGARQPTANPSGSKTTQRITLDTWG